MFFIRRELVVHRLGMLVFLCRLICARARILAFLSSDAHVVYIHHVHLDERVTDKCAHKNIVELTYF